MYSIGYTEMMNLLLQIIWGNNDKMVSEKSLFE